MAEDDGGRDAVDVSHVYHNRDLLKDCHARGGGAHAPDAPLVLQPMLPYDHLYPSGIQ